MAVTPGGGVGRRRSARVGRLASVSCEALAVRVERAFAPGRLGALLNRHGTATERLAVEWMRRGGRRWRPLLTVCAARLGASGRSVPDEGELFRAAVGIECFHKASLIHDDIEDGDTVRYGEPTLHRACGVALALNTGDFLIGEGYRLLNAVALPPGRRRKLIELAAEGHRALALGQGEELWLRRTRAVPTVEQAVRLYRLKTGAAFGVALAAGGVLGGVSRADLAALLAASESLGVAYQVRDDLDEWDTAPKGRRPLLRAALDAVEAPRRRRACADALLERHAREALGRIETLASPALRSVLRQLVRRMVWRPAAS